MFSKQAILFDKLAATGMKPDQVDILKKIFCNPKATLKHEGHVEFTTRISGADIRTSRWAKCTYNWQYDGSAPSKGGGLAYIYAEECNGPNGAGITGSQLKIYLPVPGGQDPNVESGDVIAFSRAEDGTYFALGYGDNRIGSIIMGTQADSGTKGYALCNGTANGSGGQRGKGSGANLSDKFPRCWTSSSTSGNTGGSAASNLTIEGTFTANGIGNHSHELNESSIAAGDGSSGTISVVTGSNTADEGIDLGTVSVTFTGAGGSGTPSAATIPPYTYVSFLERVDNSRNILGA